MRWSHIPMVVFALLSLTMAGLTAYYLPILRDQVATHFGPGGRADRWLDHAHFIEFVVVCIGISAALFLSADLVVRRPDIKIPNKAYWLAPGRRDDTLAFVRSWIRWVAALILGLLTLVTGMGLRANLTAPPHFPEYAAWMVPSYLLLLVAMVVALLWRFRASAD